MGYYRTPFDYFHAALTAQDPCILCGKLGQTSWCALGTMCDDRRACNERIAQNLREFRIYYFDPACI